MADDEDRTGDVGPNVVPYVPSTKYPPTRERDLALGRFMDAWSQLEAALRALLSALSQAPAESSFSIAAAIPDLGRMKDLLLALGNLYLSESEDLEELTEICDCLVIYGRYRNSIVHGQWGFTNNRDKISVRGVVHDFMWIRIYTMIDKQKEFHAAIGGDRKAANQYVFTVPRLEERTVKTFALMTRIDNFLVRIKGRIGKVEGSM